MANIQKITVQNSIPQLYYIVWSTHNFKDQEAEACRVTHGSQGHLDNKGICPACHLSLLSGGWTRDLSKNHEK